MSRILSSALLLALVGALTAPANAVVLGNGASARINENGDGMPCFPTEKALSKFEDALSSKDKYGEMDALRDAVFLKVGEHVRAIGHAGFLFSEVRLRLESGPDAGTACWEPADVDFFKDVNNPR